MVYDNEINMYYRCTFVQAFSGTYLQVSSNYGYN